MNVANAASATPSVILSGANAVSAVEESHGGSLVKLQPDMRSFDSALRAPLRMTWERLRAPLRMTWERLHAPLRMTHCTKVRL